MTEHKTRWVQGRLTKYLFTYPEILETLHSTAAIVDFIFRTEPLALESNSTLLRIYRKNVPFTEQRKKPRHLREYDRSEEWVRVNGEKSRMIARVMVTA